ncbi:hypothetical protein [Reyranella sp.]|uniref:hypothetical protein n=1 Tax=Reyranella sp. TaxID=1929291 RepID=UPI003F72F7B8
MEPRITAMTEGIAAKDQRVVKAIPAEKTSRAGDQLVFMCRSAMMSDLLSDTGEFHGEVGVDLVDASDRLISGVARGQCGCVFCVCQQHARTQHGKHPAWQRAKSAPYRFSQKSPHWPAPLPVRAAVPAKCPAAMRRHPIAIGRIANLEDAAFHKSNTVT